MDRWPSRHSISIPVPVVRFTLTDLGSVLAAGAHSGDCMNSVSHGCLWRTEVVPRVICQRLRTAYSSSAHTCPKRRGLRVKVARTSIPGFVDSIQILYNLLFAHRVLNESGEQSDGTSL